MKKTAKTKKLTKTKLKISSPATFAGSVTSNHWKRAKHLDLIDEKLVRISQGNLRRLIINMPPRHGKSELISKYFPAWFLGNFPGKRIILTSYESTFAAQWGKKVRDLLSEHGSEYFGIEIDNSSSAANFFKIKGHSGSMTSTGAGGPITGKGADLLIIDDPVKNDAEANSPVMRENIWEWFRATALTRLEPGAAAIIIMTRWHEDDLCGKIEREFNYEKQEWEVLKLPAIAEPKDKLKRRKGSALWPERYPLKELKKMRANIGSFWFSSLYQQRPAPAEGGIFKRSHFRYFSIEDNICILQSINGTKKIPYERCKIMASMDLAVSVSERSDYTVIIIFALTPDHDILILDLIREKFEGSRHMDMIKNVYHRFKPLQIGIEIVQYQLSLVQTAVREGLPAISLKPDKDKLSRALAVQPYFENGSIYFRSGAEWLPDLEDELLKFPNASHDDQVDTLSYAIGMAAPVTELLPAGAKSERQSKRVTRGF